MTEPSSAPPLADLAYERIREMVLRRRIRPGEQTSVAKLAAVTNLGRSPVKEAITRLVSEGLLAVSDRRGTTVVQLTEEDVAHLFELRHLFEQFAAHRAAEHVTTAALAELDGLLAVLEEESLSKPVERQSVARFIDADVRFHAIIMAAAGNPQLDRHFRLLNMHLLISDYLFRYHAGMREERHRDHVQMVEALRAGDGARLAALLHEHSEAVRRTIVAAMEVESRER